VILKVPAVVGFPVIAPVLAFKLSPAGSVPLVMLHVNGGTPPASCKITLYAVPTVPFAREVVVTDGGGVTVMLSVAVLVVSLTDAAVSVTVRFAATLAGAV